jgi:hypothetical protein
VVCPFVFNLVCTAKEAEPKLKATPDQAKEELSLFGCNFRNCSWHRQPRQVLLHLMTVLATIGRMPQPQPVQTCRMAPLNGQDSVRARWVDRSDDCSAFFTRFTFQNVRVGGSDSRVSEQRMVVGSERTRQSIRTSLPRKPTTCPCTIG